MAVEDEEDAAAVLLGVPVALLMLGVPLWLTLAECKKGRVVRVRLLRWWLLCALLVLIPLLLALLFGAAVLVVSTAAPAPLSSQVPVDCRIVSKGVDLRSAKVCIPKQLGYASKEFLRSSKLQCYFDYYWASVFKVEFRPFLSSLPVQASAEAPRRALPTSCRPNFVIAWKIKEMYQVNETYPCRYSPGNLLVVDIADDLFSDCKPEDLSIIYLAKQVFILLFMSEHSVFSDSSEPGFIFWKAFKSVYVAICYSLLVTGFAKAVTWLRFKIFECRGFTEVDIVYFESRLQISFILVAFLFWAIWYCGQDDFASGFELACTSFFQHSRLGRRLEKLRDGIK